MNCVRDRRAELGSLLFGGVREWRPARPRGSRRRVPSDVGAATLVSLDRVLPCHPTTRPRAGRGCRAGRRGAPPRIPHRRESHIINILTGPTPHSPARPLLGPLAHRDDARRDRARARGGAFLRLGRDEPVPGSLCARNGDAARRENRSAAPRRADCRPLARFARSRRLPRRRQMPPPSLPLFCMYVYVCLSVVQSVWGVSPAAYTPLGPAGWWASLASPPTVSLML